MTKLRKILGDIVEDVGVYFFTLLGLMLSQYAPMLLKQGKIEAELDWIRVGISAGIALYLVARDENEGDKEGRHKNLKKRLYNACMTGIGWNTIINLSGRA